MMSRGNEKSGFGVYIRPAFWLSAFFVDRIIYYCSSRSLRKAETLAAVSAAPASSSSAFVP